VSISISGPTIWRLALRVAFADLEKPVAREALATSLESVKISIGLTIAKEPCPKKP